MFACICHGITEEDIETAVAQGLNSMQKLRSQLDVTNQCGRCTQFVKSTLESASERYDLAVELV
ncbi:(2Fe-2S)-binding protein [Psychromonas marina]|uniref:Bacterioferritin-associated ferredoxin n=1 Tax=Psychromonas marina TaxID=88364 RepID=A0ABQ6DWJ5_9GAMM|nr:(2Fe-2S)-binding protein [Psychromonas marina]GLS89522.1 (2Fe-2S)-binding protein [Psychromonas marina]